MKAKPSIKDLLLLSSEILIAFVALYSATIFLVSEPLGDAAERYLVKLASPFIANLTYHSDLLPAVRNAFSSQRQTASFTNVVTVVIDDSSLQSENSSFPLSFEQYAHHIELISLRKPKAIFIDMWLHDNRANDQSMTELVETICSLANPPADSTQRPIRIYLLSFRPFGRLLHPELQKVSNHDVPAGQSSCFTEVSAVVPAKEPEQQGWYYPFKTCHENNCANFAREECVDCLPSAAVAIFNDLLAGTEAEKIPESQTGNFQLVWSNRSPDQQALNSFFSAVYGDRVEVDQDCLEQKSTLYFLSYFLPDIEGVPFLSSNQRMCNPFVKLNTFELELARKRIHVNGAGKYIREQLNDSIVIYGYDLAGVNDFVESPIHGSTLGLNFHATAIQNLDRIGDGVIRESGYESFRNDALSKEGLYLMGLSAIGALVHTMRRRLEKRDSTVKSNEQLSDGQKVFASIKAFTNVALVFTGLIALFIAMNAMYLKLDYTVLVEGIFFVMALSSLMYVNLLVDLLTRSRNLDEEKTN